MSFRGYGMWAIDRKSMTWRYDIRLALSITRSGQHFGPKHIRSYASAQKYSDTLRLPKTTFPLRPDHYQDSFRSEPRDLYVWQRDRSSSSLGSTTSSDQHGDFVLHDGPPFANGNLHIGHALNKILKDIIVRRKILDGTRVKYVPGWDCHGLPIELKALQARTESSNDDQSSTFQALSPPTIRTLARQLAQKTIISQSLQFQKMAICADWGSPYKTLDLTYELAQLSVFADMVEKGLIYRAKKPVYWSPSSCTALAEAELEYSENHISHSAYVAYPLSASFKGHKNLSLLIWTTTPWTLPANRAIAINPELDYCIVGLEEDERRYIVAASLLDSVKRFFTSELIVFGTQFLGSALLEQRYKDVFNTDSDSRPILAADYVSADSGTGLVHTAPGHGMEDYLLCRELAEPIEAFSPLDDAGNYTSAVGIPELIGLNVQNEGSKRVIQLLQDNGTLIASEKYKHKYPYDWRTKKPVIVRATPQFFADLSTIKDAAVKALAEVKMVPASGKARLSSYVASRDEWCISRQRSWGVPIPALYAADGEVLISKSSIMHIIQILQTEGMDAWFMEDESVDDWKKWVPEALQNGKKWVRGRETLDVWFDSGCSWTTLQGSAPSSPIVADLYLEGSDQHRGWFQSSLLTSVSTRGVAPYKQVLTHGFVLDHKGHKMSKSIGNVIDPLLIISGRSASDPVPVDSTITDKKKRKQLEKLAREAAAEIKPLGIDALRLWVAQSDYTSDVNVSTTILAHVAESLRKFRTTIRYMIGNLEDFDPEAPVQSGAYTAIDQYALAMSQRFRADAEMNFQSFTFNKVVASLNQYTNATLSAFYFDTLKDRLYADGVNSPSRQSAQRTLFRLLKDYLIILAPICPVMVREVWHYMPDRLTAGALHIYASGWSQKPNARVDIDEAAWTDMMKLRDVANKQLEFARSQKLITSSLQAGLEVRIPRDTQLPVPDDELANFFIVSDVSMTRDSALSAAEVTVHKAKSEKCPRCWTYTSSSTEVVCGRCKDAMAM